MKRYFVLMTLLILVLFAVYDGHTQTAAVTSKDVVIALDNSLSMKVNDPEYLISEVAAGILDGLSEDSQICFIVFAEEPQMAMPLTPVTEAGIDDKVKKILERLTYAKPGIIASIRLRSGDTLWDLSEKYYGDPYKWRLILEANDLPKSGEDLPIGNVIQIPAEDAGGIASRTGEEERTNIPAAVEKAIYELKQNGRENVEKQIVFITDGIIDIEDSALAVERYRWLKDELALESRETGIRLFGVALSEQADFEFMQSLAIKTGGGYYRVFKTEDIQTMLNGINEATSKSRVEPAPEAVQVVKTAPMVKPAEKSDGFPLGLLVVMVGGGSAVLGFGAFILIKNKRRSPGRRDKSIPGAYLMDLSGVTEKSNYPINRNIVKIGRQRSPDMAISIDKSTVSGAHAQIEYKDGGFFVTDLGSTNGTYVNDGLEKVTDEVRLKAGDIISFDQYKFKLVIHGQGDRGMTQTGRNKPAVARPNSSPKISDTQSMTDISTDISREETATNDDVMKLEAYLEDAGEVTDKKSHKMDKRIIKIGRASGNDICINENTISATHAQIEYKGHNFYLTDLGSRNGTYLNEERARITSEVCLKGDDVIYFDQHKFKFIAHNPNGHREAELSASPGKTVGK